MGNNNSAIDFEYKISANDYKPIEKIKDPRLGELIQMKHNVTEQTIMMKEKTIKDSDTYKRTLEEYVNHMALKHRNLGRVYGFAGADSQEKNKAKIYIYFEYFPETLHGEINAKKLGVAQKAPATKGSSKFFDEPSLFKIAAEIVDVLEYLQQNSISHGEIKPDSCFVSKSGSVKIMDRKLVCDTTSAYELVKEGDRTFFLTPKAFSCIKKGLNEPIEDKYRADVFSLGLTLLECATLKPSSQIYDWNNYSLNLTLLSNRLIEVKDRYSASFYNLLKGMVRIEEEQRPDFITLKNVLEEEGWINAYATSSPNFTDDEIVPELITQVESKKNAPAIQTKGLRDSQHPVLVSPTKSPMPQKGGNSMFSHSIFGKDKPQNVQKHLVDTRGPLSTDEHMEDILPSERVYNVNKVPEATINRSAGTPKGLMSRTGSTSLQEMVLSRNTLDRPRDIRDTVSSNNVGGYYINDKFKNKFSKLHGTFSKTSTSTSFPNKASFQQAQQSFETPKQSQSQAFTANNKTKAIFSDKPEFTKNAPSSTLPDHSVFSEEPSSIIGYQYNYDSAQVRREFCVENLLQEALQRSAKHPNLTLLHQAPQNRSQSDKLNSIPPRILGSVARRPSEKTLGGVSPFGKSKLTINCDYNNSEQSMRDNITPFTIPSNKISFKEDDCNSEVTYFAPGAQTKPENFISSQNSFLEFDSVRSSHRPIVVDVVENANEFNKFLIDSIVKPETFKAKALGNIGHSPFGKQKNQNLQAQRDQVVCREFQTETNQVPDINKNFQPKELAKLIGKEAPKTEKIGLDTSLEEDLDKAQKEVYTYSKGLSTGEEIGSQGYGSNQFNANKFAEEDPLEELIQKAIERSRQTYLMTTGGLAEAYRNENVASNASESKFSDILASNNGINNEQFKTDYESKFAPCSQIES